MTRNDSPLVHGAMVRWHLSTAMLWLCISLFAGLLYSLQLLQHWPLPKIEVLSPGRIRMIHTNLIAFGFLTNAFFAMLYWTVPRLTGVRVASRRLGWTILVAWNAIVLATYVGLHLGQAQAVEWGETPVWVDPLVVVGAILVWIQFYTPIVKTKERSLYVSLWYFSAGFVWLGLTYIMGNFIPQYLVAGNAAGPLLGLYIHDLVGLWVTPMGWGMMYFFVPIILRKPIWSHALSLVGFWGLAFFYPLQGVHHFLGSPIPMFAQYSAVISTIAIEIVVTTVIINFFMTWKGSEGSLKRSIPIRWFWVGALNYFITCLQCAFQVTLTFQQVIHFTDWVVGHAHLVMFGVFSFWIFGMIEHLWPKLTGREWWSLKLRSISFWTTAIGLSGMFLTLTAGGLLEGFMSLNLVPRETILEAMRPFWFVRTTMGFAIIAGVGCLATNMVMTVVASRAAHADFEYAPYEEQGEEASVGTI
ncbi:MAG: cytochrome oxidase [Acidobacteria bacterium]|nr:cytochrome oxidase [Acidobacteriota bacterium]NIM60134.1 cytochrome oxidase [Acidobacteriota bacterium]NIO57803.1 cytochrome oxidase [Acidobacteriota bacterium]NIQ28812.1 cytochrome oxidase [Acidobacteriota bacterium]NIQ83270.1 cytochrome oxidase [Acidobacteriota bacterium]